MAAKKGAVMYEVKLKVNEVDEVMIWAGDAVKATATYATEAAATAMKAKTAAATVVTTAAFTVQERQQRQ